jgi:uncharacterized integral membrane protein
MEPERTDEAKRTVPERTKGKFVLFSFFSFLFLVVFTLENVINVLFFFFFLGIEPGRTDEAERTGS